MRSQTAIAERPSYSRGPDGRYPFGVASFRSTMGKLLSDTQRLSTRGSYMEANAAFEQIAVVKAAEKAHRVREESARQLEERRNLDRAYRIEKVRFEAEWARRIEEVESECDEKMRILREVHDIARQDVDKQARGLTLCSFFCVLFFLCKMLC